MIISGRELKLYIRRGKWIMKKIGVILIFAIAAFVFVGCGDEGTSIAWKNDQPVDKVQEIQWMSGGQENQRWGGTYAAGEITDAKVITKLTGVGNCLDDSGDPAEISINVASSSGIKNSDGRSATIEENKDALIVIDTVAKK